MTVRRDLRAGVVTAPASAAGSAGRWGQGGDWGGTSAKNGRCAQRVVARPNHRRKARWLHGHRGIEQRRGKLDLAVVVRRWDEPGGVQRTPLGEMPIGFACD